MGGVIIILRNRTSQFSIACITLCTHCSPCKSMNVYGPASPFILQGLAQRTMCTQGRTCVRPKVMITHRRTFPEFALNMPTGSEHGNSSLFMYDKNSQSVII